MITIAKKPYQWVSAHREVKYTFDYEAYDMVFAFNTDSTVTTNTTLYGKMYLLVPAFSDPATVGMLIYISTGIYKGYHVIAEVIPAASALFIITETNYTQDQAEGTVALITSHVVVIFKGSTSAPLAPYFPFEQIATFKPEPNPDGQLVFNVSGYINKVFDVRNSNDTALINNLTVYYNLYEPIIVRVLTHNTTSVGSMTFQQRIYALNSSISMEELNREYVDTGRHLNSGSLGNFYRSCGVTKNIMITNTFVREDVPYNQGNVEYDGDFNNDFNADFFRRQ